MFSRHSDDSMIETLLSVLVIGFGAIALAFILLPIERSRIYREPVTPANVMLENFRSVLDAFSKDCGRYPTTKEGLDALIENPGLPGWNGPYISGEVPLDPWGTEAYRYDLQDGRPHIVCAGPDGKFNTPDDISSDQSK